MNTPKWPYKWLKNIIKRLTQQNDELIENLDDTIIEKDTTTPKDEDVWWNKEHTTDVPLDTITETSTDKPLDDDIHSRANQKNIKTSYRIITKDIHTGLRYNFIYLTSRDAPKFNPKYQMTPEDIQEAKNAIQEIKIELDNLRTCIPILPWIHVKDYIKKIEDKFNYLRTQVNKWIIEDPQDFLAAIKEYVDVLNKYMPRD